MAFFEIFGTQYLKNDNSCEKADLLLRKLIISRTIVKIVTRSPGQVFMPKNGLLAVICPKNGEMTLFFMFWAISEVM